MFLSDFDNIIASCIERNVTYFPLDIPGHGRTAEPNVEACQNRCANTKGCSYFSFWDNGGCHLSGPEATKRNSCPKPVWNCGKTSAGPKLCSGMDISINIKLNAALSKTGIEQDINM